MYLDMELCEEARAIAQICGLGSMLLDWPTADSQQNPSRHQTPSSIQDPELEAAADSRIQVLSDFEVDLQRFGDIRIQ